MTEFNHKKVTTVCTNKSNEVEFTRINIKFFGPAHLVRPGPELESMNRSGPTLGRKRWAGENARGVLSTGPGT